MKGVFILDLFPYFLFGCLMGSVAAIPFIFSLYYFMIERDKSEGFFWLLTGVLGIIIGIPVLIGAVSFLE